MIREIERLSLVDKSYEIIKQDIISGNLKEGCKIPSENQLSKTLGVSRVIVRMALEKLRKEHFLVTYQGKGSFVANKRNFHYFPEAFRLNFDEFCDVMEFRSAIEYSAIKRAVSEGEESELQEILALAVKMKEAENDIVAFTEADYEFHYQIIKASQNKVFLKMIDSAKDIVYSALETMNKLEDGIAWAINLHREIAELILKRDSKAAIELLKRNGEYNLARMNEIFKNKNT